jgi:small-conductance mechanosensitive channel
MKEAVENNINPAGNVLIVLVVCAICILAAFFFSTLVMIVLRRIIPSENLEEQVKKFVPAPLRVLLIFTVLRISYSNITQFRNVHGEWDTWVYKILASLIIISMTWFLVAWCKVWENQGLKKLNEVSGEMQRTRYIRTQITVIRRLVSAILGAITVLLCVVVMFPAVRQFGASIFASAGVISVVLGLAAQSTLGNMFSGIQIALTGAVRIGDTVRISVDNGKVEEITMTYVVIRLWDDRRIIVPSNYFTSNPFENWSINDEELSGTVNLDLDWNVPIAQLRQVFQEIMETEPNWDGRIASLKVASAVNGWVRVQVIVSAISLPELRDLQASVRERLVTWVQTHAKEAFPKGQSMPVRDTTEVLDAGANSVG